MCGIAGVVSPALGKKVNTDIVSKISYFMKHRGPDGQGLWVNDQSSVSLAHRRLAIVDLSDSGAQPMSDSSGRIHVTFNGEIYNYKELRLSLESGGHQFQSECDTEVLLYLYKEYGRGMVEFLDGDFAFAIWDSERKCLFAARDRMGVKPFYYAEKDGMFYFSSELSALVKSKAVELKLNKTAVFHYLSYLVAPPPLTLVEGVWKLPAASWIEVQQGENDLRISSGKYWRPLADQEFDSIEEANQSLSELLNNSIEKRLQSDVPVGVLFSGGVDSTLNTVLFNQKINPRRVRTYNVCCIDDPKSVAESKLAKRLSLKFNTEHFEKVITESQMIASIDAIVDAQDEPISDPVAIPLYHICKFARETGTTVLHAGEGADEMFCGYHNYRRFLKAHDRYWQMLKMLPKSINSFMQLLIKAFALPSADKICDVLQRACAGEELFLSSAIAFYDSEREKILSKTFSKKMAGLRSMDSVKALYDELYITCPNATQLQKMTFIESQVRLPELLLMRADKMSMAHGVEVRVPFLDRNLVDFAIHSPDAYKLHKGVSKWPLKQMVAPFLGQSETYATKRGFGAPIVRWMNGALGRRLADLLIENREQWGEIFNVDALLQRIQKGQKRVNEGFQMWVILNLILWVKNLEEV